MPLILSCITRIGLIRLDRPCDSLTALSSITSLSAVFLQKSQNAPCLPSNIKNALSCSLPFNLVLGENAILISSISTSDFKDILSKSKIIYVLDKCFELNCYKNLK